jgi:hypothetical protein
LFSFKSRGGCFKREFQADVDRGMVNILKLCVHIGLKLAFGISASCFWKSRQLRQTGAVQEIHLTIPTLAG